MRPTKNIRALIRGCNRRHDAKKLRRILRAYATSINGHPYQDEVRAWHADLWPLEDELREAEFARDDARLKKYLEKCEN